jgi:septum formation protein
VLEGAGLPFVREPSGVDEARVKAGAVMEPEDLALVIARAKASARAQLAQLRGRVHRVINGLVLARDGRELWRHHDEARLEMRSFDDVFLDAYLAEAGPEVLESVGAYRLEGKGAQLFTRIDGDFFSILGLPLLPLLAALRREGLLA